MTILLWANWQVLQKSLIVNDVYFWMADAANPWST